jgi:UDP-2,3-diacylglucosamine pyrophosphatase LpxH
MRCVTMHGNGARFELVKHVSKCMNKEYYDGFRNVDVAYQFGDQVYPIDYSLLIFLFLRQNEWRWKNIQYLRTKSSLQTHSSNFFNSIDPITGFNDIHENSVRFGKQKIGDWLYVKHKEIRNVSSEVRTSVSVTYVAIVINDESNAMSGF